MATLTPNYASQESSSKGKRKTYSPISAMDVQAKSKFKPDTASEDLISFLSDENIDLQKGMKLLIKLQLESNNTVNRLIEIIDNLTVWLSN
ncbi:hypothetical protein JTE90_004197 [Oedothorax gibbosus]|uniref:Uncharacterized protein n=1 Tax=Oedothorax gibbosus TaxID=931172 RepID=A0AAV6V3U2_9ARAC|nr:hypothetical protein JTE90_004197 [Oedothorax gibbosus]